MAWLESASEALAGDASGLESTSRTGRTTTSLAGFTTAMSTIAPKGLSDEPPTVSQASDRRGRRRDAERRAERKKAPRTRFTWRVLVFLLLLIAVIGGALATIQWYGTSTYFVTFEQDEVVIYRGRPGGILWVDPTLEATTDIAPSRRAGAVRRGHRGRRRVRVPRGGERLHREHRAGHRGARGGDELHDHDDPARLDDLHDRGHDHHPGQLMLRAVRRNTELGLIVLGTLVTVGAYVLASLAEDATIPADIGAVPRRGAGAPARRPRRHPPPRARTPTARSCRSPGC